MAVGGEEVLVVVGEVEYDGEHPVQIRQRPCTLDYYVVSKNDGVCMVSSIVSLFSACIVFLIQPCHFFITVVRHIPHHYYYERLSNEYRD